MPHAALAVDIGGTKVEAALIDDAGRVLEGTRHRRPTGREASRDALTAAIRDAAAAAVASAPGVVVIGVGAGSAGPVDTTKGTTSPLNLPNGAELEVVEILREVVPGVPVHLALDGACLVMAEHWLGAAKGARKALAMVVSTGVGGGLLVDGRVASGRTGNAGHIGQIRLREPGEHVLDGTLEALASGPSTVAWARSRGWAGTTGEELATSYAAGDQVARDAVRRSATAVGEGIASTAALLDLEVAVIAGGFVNVAPDYFDIVRESVRRHAPLPHVADVEVLPSPLDGQAPLLGAAFLVHGGDGPR
ncbi:ROK family protein [Microbacterium timonense]|uniref:ROK family protein n=1 Tax=Microbacterium timonense TaxID=2086576 RepID=UPI001F491F2D|nr:ROK family protein [Microbacterium timonense]